MASTKNTFGQSIGLPVPDWKPAPLPPREPMDGRYARLEPLAPAHAEALHAANTRDDGRMWTYMTYGPFATLAAYRAWVDEYSAGKDPLFFTIVDKQAGKPVGVASHMRIDPRGGVIEVGHLAYSPLLQKTPAATEAMFLMMQRAFALGYRRYEWKCDSLNAPSRRAAQRYGFSYEGIFRQATVYKSRNRDTAWFSILDGEWPALKAAFKHWLAPENFDADGRQKVSLVSLTSPLLKAGDPG
ncbi:MAG: GNAT family N-acetyltransferase [Burkholderiales bacterium]